VVQLTFDIGKRSSPRSGRVVRIIKDIRDADYGLRTFVLADPDGNRIDIGQPLRPIT
jgi:hypothetical protein